MTLPISLSAKLYFYLSKFSKSYFTTSVRAMNFADRFATPDAVNKITMAPYSIHQELKMRGLISIYNHINFFHDEAGPNKRSRRHNICAIPGHASHNLLRLHCLHPHLSHCWQSRPQPRPGRSAGTLWNRACVVWKCWKYVLSTVGDSCSRDWCFANHSSISAHRRRRLLQITDVTIIIVATLPILQSCLWSPRQRRRRKRS